MRSRKISDETVVENDIAVEKTVSANGAREKIAKKIEFWSNEFEKMKIRFRKIDGGFLIHTDDHALALRHIKYVEPSKSAETAALFFVHSVDVK